MAARPLVPSAIGYLNRQAIDLLEFARRTDPNSTRTVDRILADLYLAEAMPQEAAACYARIIQAAERATADDYLRLGMACFQSQELNSAQHAFQQMEQMDPNDARARLFLGHVAVEQDRLPEAQDCYETALAKDPTSTETMLALAQLHMRQRRYAPAAARFGEALKNGDHRAGTHHDYLLALMHAAADESQLKPAFQTALAEHPADGPIMALLERLVSRLAAAPTTPIRP